LFKLKITIQLYGISEGPIYVSNADTQVIQENGTTKLQEFGTKLTNTSGILGEKKYNNISNKILN